MKTIYFWIAIQRHNCAPNLLSCQWFQSLTQTLCFYRWFYCWFGVLRFVLFHSVFGERARCRFYFHEFTIFHFDCFCWLLVWFVRSWMCIYLSHAARDLSQFRIHLYKHTHTTLTHISTIIVSELITAHTYKTRIALFIARFVKWKI